MKMISEEMRSINAVNAAAYTPANTAPKAMPIKTRPPHASRFDQLPNGAWSHPLFDAHRSENMKV